MKNKIFILLILILPLTLSGCFKKANHQQAEPAVSYNIFTQDSIDRGGYKVKYQSDWQVIESSSGRFGEVNDQVIFKDSEQEEISVLIYAINEEAALLEPYIIESESQTQVDVRLANDYLVQSKDNQGQRFRLISVIDGKYIYHLISNSPSSDAFNSFINNISFLEYPPEDVDVPYLSPEVTIKLFFDDLTKENDDCLPDGYQEVIITRPKIEIGLIPDSIKALLQASAMEELEQQDLTSAIPLNTRLLSFGYENNTAIVNFNEYLNEGGGSCMMAMRRGQITETLKALNNISQLQITSIEIQVNGQTEEVLQP